VGGWSSTRTPLPQMSSLRYDTKYSCCHLSAIWTVWCHIHRNNGSEWSYKLFVLQSFSNFGTWHNALSYVVVRSVGAYSVEESELLSVVKINFRIFMDTRTLVYTWKHLQMKTVNMWAPVNENGIDRLLHKLFFLFVFKELTLSIVERK
jgi:hypothetical protein